MADPSYSVTDSSILDDLMAPVENLAEEAAETIDEAEKNGEHVIEDIEGFAETIMAIIRFINAHRCFFLIPAILHSQQVKIFIFYASSF